MALTRLCALTDIPDGNSTGLSIPDGAYQLSLILVRRDREVFVYRNQCPHEGDLMQHAPGKFLDDDAKYILCASHWAVFRIEDGLCVQGPCLGDGLTPYPVSITNNDVFIDV
ncbi:MAG: Rieske (2Fe-2S) protein [Rhodospirillales bacterium]|jgi:nitrite reductase/ring-hydroxylating ferredoxin subunit